MVLHLYWWYDRSSCWFKRKKNETFDFNIVLKEGKHLLFKYICRIQFGKEKKKIMLIHFIGVAWLTKKHKEDDFQIWVNYPTFQS